MREMLIQRAQLEGPEGPLEEKGVMLPPNFPSPQCPFRERERVWVDSTKSAKKDWRSQRRE